MSRVDTRAHLVHPLPLWLRLGSSRALASHPHPTPTPFLPSRGDAPGTGHLGTVRALRQSRASGGPAGNETGA